MNIWNTVYTLLTLTLLYFTENKIKQLKKVITIIRVTVKVRQYSGPYAISNVSNYVQESPDSSVARGT